MESKTKIMELMDRIGDFFNEQAWFQQIKAKWDELDAQSRMYLQFSGAGIGALLVILLLFNYVWSVHSLKREVQDKAELLSMIQRANDEIRNLQGTNKSLASLAQSTSPGATPQPPENWPQYLETTAGSFGVAKGSLNISEAKPGATNDVSKESLIDVTLKRVNIKQAVKFAQGLESGGKPVKLRGMKIDTSADMTGYLDVTFSLSTFVLVQK